MLWSPDPGFFDSLLARVKASQYSQLVMEDTQFKKMAAPILLGLAVAAIIGLGIRYDMQQTSDFHVQQPARVEQSPRELWRCHACARITGKNWTPCQTVTGRGSKVAAQKLVKSRVCSEAQNPETECRITRMDCRQLNDADISQSAAKRTQIVIDGEDQSQRSKSTD